MKPKEVSGGRPLLCSECAPAPPAVYGSPSAYILIARLLKRPGGESYSLQRLLCHHAHGILPAGEAKGIRFRAQSFILPTLPWILYKRMSPTTCRPAPGPGPLGKLRESSLQISLSQEALATPFSSVLLPFLCPHSSLLLCPSCLVSSIVHPLFLFFLWVTCLRAGCVFSPRMGGSASLDHYALKLCPDLLLGTNPRSPAATHGPAHLWQSQKVHSPCSIPAADPVHLANMVSSMIHVPATGMETVTFTSRVLAVRVDSHHPPGPEALNGVSVWGDSSFEDPRSVTTFPTHPGPWTNTPIIRDEKTSGWQCPSCHNTQSS